MSAVNPASFANHTLGLQAPSGIGPGAVDAQRSQAAAARPQTQQQDPLPQMYTSPSQASRPFAGAANAGVGDRRYHRLLTNRRPTLSMRTEHMAALLAQPHCHTEWPQVSSPTQVPMVDQPTSKYSKGAFPMHTPVVSLTKAMCHRSRGRRTGLRLPSRDYPWALDRGFHLTLLSFCVRTLLGKCPSNCRYDI
jgi:hypothetical protein